MKFFIICAAAIGSAVVAILLQKQEDGNATKRKPKRQPAQFKPDMTEREYILLIPDVELRRVKKLLRRIYDARGWGDASREHHAKCDSAWAAVLELARSAAGGAWQDDFAASELAPAPLSKLIALIDQHLLGGSLHSLLAKKGLGMVGCVVVDSAAGDGNWLSYFDERNSIFLQRCKWQQVVSEQCPLLCEGVLCTSRLHVLAHTLAHELVHALVFHHMPDVDARSPAYLPDDRHGPIFKLMNKRLFGHGSDSYRHLIPPAVPAAASSFGPAGASANEEQALDGAAIDALHALPLCECHGAAGAVS